MNNSFIIGKYTLESLTNGMYANPFDLLREYVQNAVDSIDILSEQSPALAEGGCIRVVIDSKEHYLSISDNGTGISTNSAYKTLLDIGNSQKDLKRSRGFRGIGRLSGLGYCDKLVFTTSFEGESEKSIITFDSKRLKELLIPGRSNEETLEEVMMQVVSYAKQPDKGRYHYFKVEMYGVNKNSGLLDEGRVKDYIVQHMPLPYSRDFRFGEIITSKASRLDYSIPSYRVDFCFDDKEETLSKPYRDVLVSDRVKHTEELIQDIIIKPFYRDGKVSAILWYAQTNFNGTVLDVQTKGVRIRKGNILVGDCFTMSRFFKEDRFNGWLVGELFILDIDVIPNSRRDDFEQNEAYDILIQQIKEWAGQVSKDIRKASYQRSLSESSRQVVENEDVNSLMVEDTEFCGDEFSLINSEESFEVAQVDLFDKLAVLLGTKDKQTKYAALNINTKLTSEQRRTLARVFDVIRDNYADEISKEFIETVAAKF